LFAEPLGAYLRLLECSGRMLANVRRHLDGTCTIARFDLLAALDRDDGQTLAHLSRALLVTAGNVTGLVDRAERDGAVERRADPSDRRITRVHLTAAGRATLHAALPAHHQTVSTMLSVLDGAERRELARLLGKLRDGLRAEEDEVEAAR
jgi:DNA-binding MarR family transcriptional regulator